MMGISQPDVTYSEQLLSGQNNDITSAVPLFIGYTQKGAAYSLSAVNSMADYASLFGGGSETGSVLYYCVQHYFDNGGQGAFVLSLGADSVLPLSAEQLITAFQDSRIVTALQQEESITLVAIPDMIQLPDADSFNWSRAWLALLSICRARNGVFGLFDTPDAADHASACIADFLASNPEYSEWGAAYWPRLVSDYQRDDLVPVTVPPSGAIAAVIEMVDQQSGVWKAPANVALSQVVKPTQSWLQSSGLFQNAGTSVNLIRSFPGKGTRIWGCRTLTNDTSSPFLYVQVRRLVAWVEKEVSAIGHSFIFETNNALTWIKFRGLVHIRLRELWLEGALYGEEEQQAFYIQIGLNETMTEEDIRQGKMIMNIGLSVTYPAEFIQICLTFDTQLSTHAHEGTV